MDEKEKNLKKEDKALRKEALELAIKGEGGLVVPSEGESTLEVAYKYYRFLRGGCSEGAEDRGEDEPKITKSGGYIKTVFEYDNYGDVIPTINMGGIPVNFEKYPKSEPTDCGPVEIWIHLNPSCSRLFTNYYLFHVGNTERSTLDSYVKCTSIDVSSALEFVEGLRVDEVDLVQIRIPSNREERKIGGIPVVFENIGTPSKTLKDKFNGSKVVEVSIRLKGNCFEKLYSPSYRFHLGEKVVWSASKEAGTIFPSFDEALEYVGKLRADEVESVIIKNP